MALEDKLDLYIGKKAEHNKDGSVKSPAKKPMFRIDRNPASTSDNTVGLDDLHYLCVPFQYQESDLKPYIDYFNKSVKSVSTPKE